MVPQHDFIPQCQLHSHAQTLRHAQTPSNPTQPPFTSKTTSSQFGRSTQPDSVCLNNRTHAVCLTHIQITVNRWNYSTIDFSLSRTANEATHRLASWNTRNSPALRIFYVCTSSQTNYGPRLLLDESMNISNRTTMDLPWRQIHNEYHSIPCNDNDNQLLQTVIKAVDPKVKTALLP